MTAVLTNENDVVVELPFVFALAVHLCHLLQSSEHSLNDLVVRRVHNLPDLERIGANELVLNTTDVGREVLDEWRYTVAFLAGELHILDGLDMLGLAKEM